MFGHIQNSTNYFATFPFLFHALQEDGVVGSFLYILAVPARLIQSTRVQFKLVLHFDKRVYKAKSSEILGCGRLQLGREGIRKLLRVVSCNSLPLSCGSILILVAAYRALLWLLIFASYHKSVIYISPSSTEAPFFYSVLHVQLPIFLELENGLRLLQSIC